MPGATAPPAQVGRIRLPSTQALLCLEAAERLGSLSRAARALHLTQGAVSRQIQGLEASLRTTLFLRTPRGLEPTPAGRAYLADVRPLLQLLERATVDLATHHGRGGRLVLSVTSSFAAYWLVPRLPAFTARHPEVTLDLSARIGPVDFAATPADAAISYCDGPTGDDVGVALVPLVLHAYASPALARRVAGGPLPERLLQVPLLRLTTVPEGWAEWADVAGADAALRERFAAATGPRYDLMSMALNAAVGGLGAALLPSFVASAAHARRALVRVGRVSWTSSRAYWLTSPRANARLPALERLRAWLLEAARDGA